MTDPLDEWVERQAKPYPKRGFDCVWCGGTGERQLGDGTLVGCECQPVHDTICGRCGKDGSYHLKRISLILEIPCCDDCWDDHGD